MAAPGADQRSADILDRVRLAFAEKGFDGASMQDLARAAGMSVGNFYRYFPSKAAIIEALIARDMHEIEQDFHAITRSADARAALREVIVRRVAGAPCARDAAIMAEITAAAFRKPEVAAIARQMEDSVTSYMTATFAQITGLSPEACAHRFEGHARLIIMLVKATLCDTGHEPARRADLTDLVLRNIDRTLDDVVADGSRG
ncbi:MAG: TetR/AcrR family transcriptional regulator [Alphaproteobacteria bacterium]|jgi:AcrR family transcriptional regulator|nr:TetR/AcrR family transcriptional regulator [Alphaproteobacteria bacterium]